MTEGQTSNPPRLATLLLLTLGVGLVATVLTLLVVLPAEFGRDPTGFGHLTGLIELAPGHEQVIDAPTGATAPAQFREAPFRTDLVEIPLAADGDESGNSELEYKVRMKVGDTLLYSWVAEGPSADALYFDLHAETPKPNVQVMEFKQGTGARSNGSLAAPLDAAHGWYWRNKSAHPLVIRLKLSGYYELIPAGEAGNKAGIAPVQQ